MQLGRVAGTLVATRKDPKMEGMKFLVLRQVDIDNVDTGGYLVAVDAVGAGVGEGDATDLGSERGTQRHDGQIVSSGRQHIGSGSVGSGVGHLTVLHPHSTALQVRAGRHRESLAARHSFTRFFGARNSHESVISSVAS